MIGLTGVGLTLLAYLLGSLPFGVIVGRLATGRDIRASGSGHSGGTNAIRQAGWRVGAVVAVLDVAKGFVALWLVRRYADTDWATVAATIAVVAGHCWPCFAGFRGGVGLSAAGGALLALYPLGFVVGLGLAIAGTLLLRRGARSNVIGGLIFGPLIWLVSRSAALGFAAGGAGIIVAIRALPDWNRVYGEVWLGRDRT